jgi:hypothetical protein
MLLSQLLDLYLVQGKLVKQLLNQWLNLDLVPSEGKLELGLNMELELQLGLCIDLNMGK